MEPEKCILKCYQIDTISDFFIQRAIVKSMFDKNDHSGVHIGPDGYRLFIFNS
jgi:hypothetical protein